MILLVSLSSMMSMSEVELEKQSRNYTSSDTGSAIQYTASHTTVSVGPSARTAILEMPGVMIIHARYHLWLLCTDSATVVLK